MAGEGFEGVWLGVLRTPQIDLRLQAKISKTDEGELQGTVDSLDQGASGLKISSISAEGSSLQFQIDRIKASFEGKLSADGSEISGKWTQSGGTLPLSLKRQRE